MKLKILYRAGWLLFRIISKLVFRIKVSGTEHLPKGGGFIVAANHISYYDPPLVGTWSRREVYFMAKQELFKSRLFGQILRRVNAMPVRRGRLDRQAMKLALEKIEQGYGLTIFPEGTRSKAGAMLDPKPGIGMIALRAKRPIVICYLHGSNRLKDCFLGRERLSITYGEPIRADWLASLPPEKESYLLIARRVMEEILNLKKKVLASSN